MRSNQHKGLEDGYSEGFASEIGLVLAPTPRPVHCFSFRSESSDELATYMEFTNRVMSSRVGATRPLVLLLLPDRADY